MTPSPRWRSCTPSATPRSYTLRCYNRLREAILAGNRWLWAFLLCTLLCAQSAFAAPDRLNDEVPDAVPDPEGVWSFGYGYQGVDLEGPLTSSSSTHSLYKLRYTFSPDAAGAVYYRAHSLTGGTGLVSPLFDSQDDATSLGFDLRLNLLNEASTYNTPGDDKTFVAGSAFDIGVNLERLSLTAGTLEQNDALMRAYLAYSTDLSDQLRAHTYFSTGRVSGDTHTGSMNRVAAGLDYNLSSGSHPLTLMADAILDIYNFRQPIFNTSRITSFDVGLRYGFNDNLYGNLGWMTFNDSENDSSGSGLFAGLQWLSEGGNCEVCADTDSLNVIVETPEAPAAAAPEPGPAPVVVEPPAPEPTVEQKPELAAQPEPAPQTPEPTMAPEPAPLSPTPEPAQAAPPDTLVLPDGRAELPIRRRVVSSLQEEFSSPSTEPESSALAAPNGYDPRSWEDTTTGTTATEATVADDDGVVVPQLDLFPETMQADAKDVRPNLRRASVGKSTSAAKEKPLPSDDQTVVEVEISPAPPEDET